MARDTQDRRAKLKRAAVRFITCWQGILITLVVLLLLANAVIPPPAVVHHDSHHADGGRYEYTGRSGTREPAEACLSDFYYIWPVIQTHFGPGEPPGFYLKQGIYYRRYERMP